MVAFRDAIEHHRLTLQQRRHHLIDPYLVGQPAAAAQQRPGQQPRVLEHLSRALQAP